MTRELLQQALDALRMAQVELSGNLYAGVRSSRVQSAITALSAALAAPPAVPAPAAPDLKHKPTVQRLMDLARKFRATPGDLYDGAYKELQQACYEALSAAPAVREPLTDEQIDALWRAPMSADWEHREFARAIEAHHGIGGGGK